MSLNENEMLLACTHSDSWHPSGSYKDHRIDAENSFYELYWVFYCEKMEQSHHDIEPTEELFFVVRDTIFALWDYENTRVLKAFRLKHSDSDEGSEIRDVTWKRITVFETISIENLFASKLRIIVDSL